MKCERQLVNYTVSGHSPGGSSVVVQELVLPLADQPARAVEELLQLLQGGDHSLLHCVAEAVPVCGDHTLVR